jgi:hypothetical protein
VPAIFPRIPGSRVAPRKFTLISYGEREAAFKTTPYPPAFVTAVEQNWVWISPDGASYPDVEIELTESEFGTRLNVELGRSMEGANILYEALLATAVFAFLTGYFFVSHMPAVMVPFIVLIFFTIVLPAVRRAQSVWQVRRQTTEIIRRVLDAEF